MSLRKACHACPAFDANLKKTRVLARGTRRIQPWLLSYRPVRVAALQQQVVQAGSLPREIVMEAVKDASHLYEVERRAISRTPSMSSKARFAST